MERLFDSISENNSFYDSLYGCLKEQRKEDLSSVRSKYTEGLEEEKEDLVEHDFDLNLDKLDFVPELSSKSEELQKKFVEVALYIDYLNLNRGNKLDAILSFAALLSSVGESIKNLSKEEAYLLSSSLVQVPLEDYNAYGTVLSSGNLLSNVISKTTDDESRRTIISEMIDHLDEVVYEGMSEEDLRLALNDCNTITNNYKLSETVKAK